MEERKTKGFCVSCKYENIDERINRHDSRYPKDGESDSYAIYCEFYGKHIVSGEGANWNNPNHKCLSWIDYETNLGSIETETIDNPSSAIFESHEVSDNWWEYETGEHFLKSLFLFPIRIIIWLIKIIIEFIDLILKISIAFIQTFVGIPYIVFALSVTIGIMLPLKIIVYIFSFGNKILWEDKLLNWFYSAMRWSVNKWNDFDKDYFKAIKVIVVIVVTIIWIAIIF